MARTSAWYQEKMMKVRKYDIDAKHVRHLVNVADSTKCKEEPIEVRQRRGMLWATYHKLEKRTDERAIKMRRSIMEELCELGYKGALA